MTSAESPTPRCGVVNPKRPASRCILALGHKGRFHRSYLTKWED